MLRASVTINPLVNEWAALMQTYTAKRTMAFSQSDLLTAQKLVKKCLNRSTITLVVKKLIYTYDVCLCSMNKVLNTR